MPKSARILAAPHPLQFPEFFGYVQDPYYEGLVECLIKVCDFVFEEAGGFSSTARAVAVRCLGPDHYIDMDPTIDERRLLGIGKTQDGFSLDCRPPLPVNLRKPVKHVVSEQQKRESEWLRRIQGQEFNRALIICGLAHSLSLAFRLTAAGIYSEVLSYEPHELLCQRVHK